MRLVARKRALTKTELAEVRWPVIDRGQARCDKWLAADLTTVQ